MADLTRDACAARDRSDPLATARDAFVLPDGVIYLDGNSLGALPKAVPARIAEVVEAEWGDSLIRAWTAHGWIDLPLRVGDRIARLVGARSGEVVVTDSTSVNLFKLVYAALKLRLGRSVVLTEGENFPTDLYMANAAAASCGAEVKLVRRAELAGAIDAATALVMLTHVDFKSGAIHDMAAITQAAHTKGALALWDLSHSAGALPVDLNAAGADLAVGCGYKYLNGGPGAPAFAFVATRHQAQIEQPLRGWLGHQQPFDFATDYKPADGIARMLCGTPPVLSLAALDCALAMWDGIDVAAVRAKSMALTSLFAELVETRCRGHGLVLASPRDAAARGSQVSFHHPDGYAVMQALIGRGVIGDFRAPDLLRFGFAPLYLRYVDAWDAVEHLAQVLERREWDQPAHRQRATIT